MHVGAYSLGNYARNTRTSVDLQRLRHARAKFFPLRQRAWWFVSSDDNKKLVILSQNRHIWLNILQKLSENTVEKPRPSRDFVQQVRKSIE
jgi:hypothetical protein